MSQHEQAIKRLRQYANELDNWSKPIWDVLTEKQAQENRQRAIEVRQTIAYLEHSVAPDGFKDHEIRTLVNKLRDVALKYHAAGHLRESITGLVLDFLKGHRHERPGT